MVPAVLPLLYTGAQWATVAGILVAALLLKLVVIVWIRRDAAARGTDALWWIVAALVAELITLLAWLVMRPRQKARPSVPPAGTRTAQSAASPAAAATAPATPQQPARPMPIPSEPDTYSVGFAGGAPLEAPAAPARQIGVTCPRCAHRFETEKVGDLPVAVQCPSCGATGRV